MNSNGAAPAITKEDIEKYKVQRLQECSAEIQSVLDKYDCELVGIPQIAEGRIVAAIQLKPK